MKKVISLKNRTGVFLLSFFLLSVLQSVSALTLPLRELVRVTSLRENQLVGYGLVVGLPQTGDTRSKMAQQALKKVLSYRGIDLPDEDLKSKNIAAVMVMAKVPPYARTGDPVDIWVSSIGDARSMKGGYLIQTPLSGADGKIYAVAQASMSPDADNSRRNSFTRKVNTLHIPGGAVIEKPVNQPLVFEDKDKNRFIRLGLIHFDINTAKEIVEKINAKFDKSASVSQNGTVTVRVPDNKTGVNFLAEIYNIDVEVTTKAKVVIDPRSGTIVMGGKVGISSISITKNGINIDVGDKTGDLFWEKKKEISSLYLEESATVEDLVKGLNKIGLKANEVIDIIKAVHAAGALHAELVIL